MKHRRVNSPEFNERVGANARRLRISAGLTQLQIYEATRIDPSHLSRFENGERGLSFEQAAVLAKAIGATMEDLLR